MAKASDIGGKRLISLSPTEWVRWVTDDPTVTALELLSNEFQWVARTNDALVKVRSPEIGEFLVATDLQLRPDKRMPKRLRAYAALGEEKFNLLVYPVVINILPPPPKTEIATSYSSELLGIRAHQDYRVINLWEVDVELVFRENLTALLPLVPVLKGGDQEEKIQEAVVQLRGNEQIADLESLLAFFATFVLKTDVVRRIMRWDMAVLRESPWYSEILKEGIDLGIEQGIEQGLEQGLEQGEKQGRIDVILHVVSHRFGSIPDNLRFSLAQLQPPALESIIDTILEASSLEELQRAIADHE